MSVIQKIRLKNSVLTCKAQSSAGSFSAPSASANAIRCENVSIGINPNVVTTNEYAASLDPNAPLVGGQKYTITVPMYLRGSGVPGQAPEWGVFAKICSLAEAVTKTDITGVDFSTDSATSKILSVAAVLTPVTVGTVVYVSGYVNAANNGEFLVATVGSQFFTVTKIDGTAATLVTESAGATVTVRYGIPGTAATAGTTTGATLQAPFAATSELYRFMPALASANPVTPFTTFFKDYTAARVASFTDIFGSTLNTSTKISVPANVLYIPASGSQTWGSLELYSDGVRWQFLDCVGSLKIDWAGSGVVRATATIEGKFYAVNDTAVPTPTYDGTKPGVWRGSRFLIDGTPVTLNSLSVDFKTTNIYPENPNDAEGFDAPIVDSRSVTATLNPHMTLRATRDAITDMRSGTRRAILATLMGAPGGTPGNRAAQIIPSLVATNAAPGQQQGLWVDNITGFCEGQDSGSAITLW